MVFNFILVDGSASLSSLQGVVASTQALRSQGPSLTPSLANYFRADLIAHVTNWPADLLEKQVNFVNLFRKKKTKIWNEKSIETSHCRTSLFFTRHKNFLMSHT